MSDAAVPHLCPDTDIAELVASLTQDDSAGLRDLDTLLVRYPADPRLHFLQGSLMAAQQDYQQARVAMRRAVDLAPDYPIARFQLGFLLLTCGEAHAAQETWGPLYGLAETHALRIFAAGLTHLIHDRFALAIATLEQGMAANTENLPLNADMQSIIDEVLARADGAGSMEFEDTLSSSTQFLLQQAALKSTRH